MTKGPVLRSAVHSFFALLMVVTYLWGGCVSCSQYFMFSSAAHDCCDKLRCKTKRSSPQTPGKTQSQAPAQDCKLMPLDRHQDQLGASISANAVLPAEVDFARVRLISFDSHRAEDFSRLASGSPPDLTILNLTFRI
jgi:hypothetical protein